MKISSTSIRSDFSKFDERENFNVWQLRVRDVLTQQRLIKIVLKYTLEEISIGE